MNQDLFRALHHKQKFVQPLASGPSVRWEDEKTAVIPGMSHSYVVLVQTRIPKANVILA